MSRDALPQSGRQRRWTRISWWYSILLPVALILLLGSVFFGRFDPDPALTGVVTDAYTGEPVEGARVAGGATAVETDGSGAFSFADPLDGALSISRDNYEATQIAVAPEDAVLTVEIRPTTLTGTVTNTRTDDPIEGASVTVTSPTRATAKTITDEDGDYLLFDVPSDATITVEHQGLSPVSQPVGQNLVLDFDVRLDIISGRIVDESGQPVENMVVRIGDVVAESGQDGSYRLVGVPDDGEVLAKRAGYRTATATFPDDMVVNLTVEPVTVRALYLTALTAGNDALWEETLQLVEDSEINAVVIDVKDDLGVVRYDSNVELADEIGAINPSYDLGARVEELHSLGIYVIARLVVFEDPILAAGRPDLAVKDAGTGGVWTTWDGTAWVNTLDSAVWQYNIDIAVEVAAAGVDEIQLDYLRFPTDGPIQVADYGRPIDPLTRIEAIGAFLTEMQAALATSPVLLAADVSGIVLWDQGDNGIGQDLDEMLSLVDIVSPMIYPAHFSPGTFGYDIPNDHPFSVTAINQERIAERFGSSAFKFRPWLQDFSSGVGIDYGPEEVRAQIDAVESTSSTGWMLWNDANVYSTDALIAQAR